MLRLLATFDTIVDLYIRKHSFRGGWLFSLLTEINVQVCGVNDLHVDLFYIKGIAQWLPLVEL